MLDMHTTIEFNDVALLKRFHLEPGGAAQEALTLATMYYMLPYWAYDTGRLANSPYDASDYTSGKIVYNVDYAYKMYYGINEDGSDVHYRLEKHPLAGPYPLDRMKADHMADIMEEVKRVAFDK